MSEALGKPVVMNCFVDADHAGYTATRRSHTGILIYLNRAPILWYSKRQSTVETSTFGSEIVAMQITIEKIEGLRYKLRMMGLPIAGATNVFYDNDSVINNVTGPESPCKKKHSSIAYHEARESVASGAVRIAKVMGTENTADLLTKVNGGVLFKEHCRRCMYSF